MSELPSYLVEFHGEEGINCDCPSTAGRWLVLLDGQYYCFNPGTQLQKDIWLGSEGGDTDKLRWYCFNCETIQIP